MPSYLIFHQRNPQTGEPDTNNDPIGTAELNNNQITLTGNQEFHDSWANYFTSPGFHKNYMNTPDPLKTFANKQTYLPVTHHTQKIDHDIAKRKLTGQPTKTYTTNTLTK